jgi:hypothetical protein
MSFSKRATAIGVLMAFALVHVALVFWANAGVGTPMGDVSFAYQPWADEMAHEHSLFGLTKEWVYPFPNLLWVLLPSWFGGSAGYVTAWLTMTAVIDIAAAAFFVFGSRLPIAHATKVVAAWGFGLLLLGPVAVSRLDTISLAFVVVAIAFWLRGSDGAAAGWLAFATWLKVWPIGLLTAVYLNAVSRRRVFIWAAGVALGVLGFGLFIGDFQNIISFVTQQSTRSVQIESPWAEIWLWPSALRTPGFGIEYNDPLKTFQVFGPGTAVISTLLSFGMLLALAITLFLGWKAARVAHLASAGNEGASNRERIGTVVVWTSLTATIDLIFFNKVGSPQYYLWLVAPALLAIALNLPKLRLLLTGLVTVLALTQLVYPVSYDYLITSHLWAVALVSARNGVMLLLLVYANLRLTALGKPVNPGKPGKVTEAPSQEVA